MFPDAYFTAVYFTNGYFPIGSGSPTVAGDSPWLPKKRKTHIFVESVPEDIEDMKLSVVLMQKLADITNVNAELMRAHAEDRLRAAIALQSHPVPVAPKPVVKHNPQVQINRVIPAPPAPEPKISPAQHMELLRRLEKANMAKEEKRQKEDAIAKQRLKNLAKARRVARKNREK